MTEGYKDADWLAAAVDLAVRNVHEGGGPFGAVIVVDGLQVGAGQNRVTRDNDPTAHAEVVAIRAACAAIGSFALDGATLYTSRGLPAMPPGIPGGTVRRLYAVASDAWYPGKPERDLSVAGVADCIEGVPKGEPGGASGGGRILLFRLCAGEPPGIVVTDTTGASRRRIGDGFGPDWNPAWTP